MLKTGLTAIRSNEHLILNKESNVFVNGSIAQYLLSHQINGVRFLYRNFEKHTACILNDESGSGKCFQCIAFCDAILRLSKTARILIICQQHTSLQHWQFHIDCFIGNVRTRIADNETDTQDDCTLNAVTIASIDYVLNNLSVFKANQMDCVIFQDQRLQASFEPFERLSGIRTTHKIFLGSDDLMNNLGYFYELLKFCQQTGPLKRSKDNGSILRLDEFKSKFGGKNDKTISKRSQAFRQQILLNACNDFYLRRLCNQLGSQFPPISAEDFQTNFEAWKTITCDTVPLETNRTQSPFTFDDDSSPIELLPPPGNRTLDTTANTVTNDEISILNIAHTNFSDFDTQMSPLIYSDSDSNSNGSPHNESADIENSQSMNSQQFTDIVCNQEHAARESKIAKATIQKNSKCSITPVKRALRTLHDKVSPNKRLNYKQLPIEIRSSSSRRSLSKTYLFRTKKQNKVVNSTEIDKCESQGMKKMTQSNRLRSVSSTSDIQIVSQAALSPIVISSEDIPPASQEPNNQNKNMSIKEVSCPSPDLFTSFSSVKSDASSQQQQQQQQQQSQSPLQQIVNSQESLCKSQDKDNKSPLRDVFGAPDECDDIDLLSNTNVDIFEITKNSVFDNVLCSANDRITPFKTGETEHLSPNPNRSCLSGLRIVLNKSNSSDAEPSFRCSTSITETPQNSSDDVLVDLTANESQKIIEISSEERDVEKTPERKHQLALSPSTRSCLKRQPNAELNSDERKCKTPRSKSGWITSVKISPKTDTPKSRRRFEKWKERTDALNMQADHLKTTRPRNLCAEFKSTPRTDRNSRRNMPSTSTAKSPPIFSDHE